MSLINQMLKDLEDRKEHTIKGQDGIISRPNSRAPGSRWPIILLSLLSIGLLTAVIYLLWQPLTARLNIQTIEATDNQPVIVPTPVATVASTTTIASLVQETDTAPKTINQDSQDGSEAPVVIAPRPAKRSVIPPSPLQRVAISHLSPAELEGSWQRQKLTVTGEHFKANSQIQLCWADKCVTLKDERIGYISPSELQISITTGIKPERWQLTVRNPNGQASNSVGFYVKASTSIDSTALSTSSDEPQRKNAAVSKRVIPLTAYQQAETYYLEAKQAEKAREPAHAITLWERAILLAPEHHASRQILIERLIASGRTVEAEGHVLQGLKLFPNYPIYHQRLAQIRASQGDREGAIGLIEEAIGRGITSAELYALGATLYQRDKQFDKSIEHYQRALTLKPDRGIWWVGLGISFEQNSQFNEALSAYQQAQNSGTLSAKLKSYVEGQIAKNRHRIKATTPN